MKKGGYIAIVITIMAIQMVQAESVRIPQSFGYKIITQTEVDTLAPAYLNSNGEICWNPIKPEDKAILASLKGYDEKLGIPLTDYRTPIYGTTTYYYNEKGDLVLNKTAIASKDLGKTTNVTKGDETTAKVGDNITKTEIIGYKTTYTDMTKQGCIMPDLKDGILHLGFESNIFVITDMSTGTNNGTVNKITSVILDQEHIENSANIVLWLEMNANESNSTYTKDSSTSNYNAVVSGATLNYSRYYFDGSDYVSTPYSWDFSSGGTAITWFKPKSLTNNIGTIIAMSNASNKRFTVQLWNNSVRGTYYTTAFNSKAINISDNNWHCVVANWNGTAFSLYLDNDYATTSANPNTNSNVGTTIGVRTAKNADFFKGEIDEVTIYTRSLSDSEIRASCNKGYYRSNNSIESNYQDVKDLESIQDIKGATCNYKGDTAGQNISIALSVSDDNSTWGSWSSEGQNCNLTGQSLVGQYVKYKARFYNNDTRKTPELLNVTIITENYTAPIYPGDITNLINASQDNQSIYFTWTNGDNTDVIAIYKDGVYVTNGSGTAYNATGLLNNTCYNYSFTPYNGSNAGNTSSLYTCTRQNSAPTSNLISTLVYHFYNALIKTIGIRFEQTTLTVPCDNDYEGTQVYNYTSHKMQYCNSTNWVTI